MYSYAIDLCASIYAIYLSLLLICKTDAFRFYFCYNSSVGLCLEYRCDSLSGKAC